MPLLPIVTNQGVMPCLLTPPCACTLKHFGSIDTLVGGSFSKTTHSLFHGTFIRKPKGRDFVHNLMYHDIRTLCTAKHIRVRTCLIASERCFLGIICRPKYHFMYRRTVKALTRTPSLQCIIWASWAHSSPRFTPALSNHAHSTWYPGLPISSKKSKKYVYVEHGVICNLVYALSECPCVALKATCEIQPIL
jgi:hypothetical protein